MSSNQNSQKKSGEKPISDTWGKRILSHRYPPLFYKYPGIIHWVYVWNRLTQLRNWYVAWALKKLLRQMPEDFSFLDVGFGEGMYLLPLISRFPKATFEGIDKGLSHIQFAHVYRQKLDSTRLSLCLQNVENLDRIKEFDLICCIGVLQYVEQDLALLKAIKKSLKPNGKLLLYVPINGHYVIPAFGRFYEQHSNYERIQKRKRINTLGEMMDKIQQARFEVEVQSFTYGFWGKLGYEGYTFFLTSLLHSPVFLKPLFFLLLIIFLPFQLLCMAIDFLLPLKSGNGVMLILT